MAIGGFPVQWSRTLSVLGLGATGLLLLQFLVNANRDTAPASFVHLHDSLPSLESTTGALAFSFVSYLLGEILIVTGSSSVWGKTKVRRGRRPAQKVALAHFCSSDQTGFLTSKLVEADQKSELFAGMLSLSLFSAITAAFDFLLDAKWLAAIGTLLLGAYLFHLFLDLIIKAYDELIELSEFGHAHKKDIGT